MALRSTGRARKGVVSTPTRNRENSNDASTTQAAESRTIGGYLIERLLAEGIGHIFGIPGDYVLRFYKMLESSPIRVIGTTREDCAGLAADAYARLHGLGAVCVTWGVGGLNLCNAIAEAYAEKSAVVVISGSPGIGERVRDPYLHHRVGDFATQKLVFERLTCASVVLDDRLTAFRAIDHALAAAKRHRRPVYIELPRDRVDAQPLLPHEPVVDRPFSDRHALHEAIADACKMIAAAKKPVILAGVELHRFGLQSELLKLVDQTQIPIASTLMSKSAVAETHPLHIGLYEGRMCRDEVRQFVEESDCILMLGCFLSDIDLGGEVGRLDEGRCLYATSEDIRIRRHHYENVTLVDFMHGLVKATPPRPATRKLPRPPEVAPFLARPREPVTIRRLFQRLNELLDDKMVVIADIGDALFAASDLVTKRHSEFLSPAYYTSMGFAVPAALGAGFARPDLRAICIVGDGAFQMTGTELSSIVRHGFNPIVIVLNNQGYGTERFIQEGPFNDIHSWNYHKIHELVGGGECFDVHTEDQLDADLARALANQKSYSLLNVHLSPNDRSPALDRLAKRLAKKL